MKSISLLAALAIIAFSRAAFGQSVPLIEQGEKLFPKFINEEEKERVMSKPIIPRGAHFIPESSIEHNEDIGVRFHTNHMLLIAPKTTALTAPQGETPQSI